MALPARGYYSVRDAVRLIYQRTGELLTDRHLLEYAADEKIEIGAHFERIRLWPEEGNSEAIELHNHYVALPINHVQVTALMQGAASFDVCRYQERAFKFHGRRSAPTASFDFGLRRVDLRQSDLVIPYSSLDRLFPAAITATVLPSETMGLTASPKDASEKPLSDQRWMVIAALLESKEINLSLPGGQAAKLRVLVEKSGYGPVSADVCERMVNEVKTRIPNWKR